MHGYALTQSDSQCRVSEKGKKMALHESQLLRVNISGQSVIFLSQAIIASLIQEMMEKLDDE